MKFANFNEWLESLGEDERRTYCSMDVWNAAREGLNEAQKIEENLDTPRAPLLAARANFLAAKREAEKWMLEEVAKIPLDTSDEEKAREILQSVIMENNHLYGYGHYLIWPSSEGKHDIAWLDGDFTADQLEAIAWWMRNKKPQT